jgi:hypothetical protein
MAKKISSSDLFEQEDLFKGVRDSASKTLAVFNELQAELKATAQGLKTELAANTQASTAQLKQFSAASEQANKLMQQAVQIEKLKAQADQQKIKAEQEIVKLQKMQAQETARLAKEQEKAAKLASNEASAYSKLSAELNKARKAYKDLAVQNQENSVEGKELLDTVTRLDAQLKKVDATVGQHQRNVGNYGEATKSLKLQLRELTQALQQMDESDPRFQQMAQDAAELKDKIDDTGATIRATTGNAVENLSGAFLQAGQLGVAAFQGVEASLQLMGIENETVLEGMRKLQALAALSDSLKTLGELDQKYVEIKASLTAALSKMGLFTSAQQAQNTAVAAGSTGFTVMGKSAKAALTGIRGGIAATGIGLLVVALGTVVAYWDDIKELVTGVSAEQKKYNEQLNKDVEAQEFKGQMLEAQENTLRLQGKSEEYITNEKIKQLDGEIKIQKAKLATTEMEVAQQVAREKDYQNYLAWYIRITLEAMAQVARIVALPFDLMIGQINLVSEALGKGKLINKNLNEFISEGLEAASQSLATMVFNPNTVASEGLKAINAQKLVVAKLESERDGLKLSLKKGDIQSGKDSIKNAEDTGAKEIDVLRRIEDEKMRIKDDSRTKDLEQLDIDYRRKLEDAKEELKDDKDKAAKLAKLEAQWTDSKRADIKAVNDKWDKIDQEAEDKLMAQMVADDQKQYEAQKKLRDAETAILKDGLEKDKALIENAYQDELWALQNQLDEKKITQEEYDKLTRLAYKKRNKDITDAELKAAQDQKEKEKKLNEERWQSTQQFAQQTTDFFKQQSDERIAQMDKEISAAEKQADYYRELAANGNISAKESLAEQERIIAESNRRKEREQKRQQRMELANTIYQTYAGHAAKDPETALMKTIKDASLLQAFISTLPMFYDGTEDTGRGGGVDGNGGFHAVLHPHERVIPKSLNDQIGNLTNEQLTRLAMEYQNGRLVGQDVAHSSLDLAILAGKLDNLTEVIKQKPETNIELGQITQSAMEIVQSTRKGNTTVYNRFKVRS